MGKKGKNVQYTSGPRGTATLEVKTKNQKTPRGRAETISPPEQLKEMGNEAFLNKEYLQAIDLYSQAIQLNDSNHIYYSNRANAYMEVRQYEKCIEDCLKAIEIDGTFMKASLRLTKAYVLTNQLGKAAEMVAKWPEHAQMQAF